MLVGLSTIAGGTKGGRHYTTATLIGYSSSDNDSATQNYGNFIIPRNGIVVVVALGRANTTYFSSCTIGGVTATLAVKNDVGVATYCPNAIVYREVVAGTYNVTINWNSAIMSSACAVYLIENYTSTTPHDTASENSEDLADTSASVSLDIPTNGVSLFGLSLVNNVAISWTNVFQDFQVQAGTESNRFSSGHKYSGAAISGHTATASFSGARNGIVAASWG